MGRAKGRGEGSGGRWGIARLSSLADISKKIYLLWWPGLQEQPSCGGRGSEQSSPVICSPHPPAHPQHTHTLLFIPLNPAISFFGQCCPLGSLWKLGPCVSLPGRGKHSDASNIVGLPPVLQLVMSDSPPGHLPMACLAKLSASFSKTGSWPAVPSWASSEPLQAGCPMANSVEAHCIFLPEQPHLAEPRGRPWPGTARHAGLS